MIKLKELIELKSMVYSEEIKPKHKKKMNRATPSFHEGIVLPKIQPPDNDSKTTIRELKELSAIEENDAFAESMDDVIETFKPYAEELGIQEYVKKVIKESVKYIMELKYHYNRPRPHQVAEFLNIDLNGSTMLDSMKTPSYPSGHAIQGYLVGEILSKHNPSNSQVYRGIGEDIAHSRIIAKAHYPSDKEYGKKIAFTLLKGLK